MSWESTIIGLSSLGVISLIPPLAWHSRTKNVPAVILMVWLFIMNITAIVGAAEWSSPDYMTKWNGKGWCDIVIKLQVGANVGIPCAVTNIIYNLHTILRADKLLVDLGSFKKICTDLAISLTTPIVVMGFSYILQVFRYGIARYNGCQNLLSPTWITVVLYTMWMLIWSVISAVYAVLVLIVFYRKRKDVRDILHCTNSGLNLVRFSRLLILCFIIITVMLPFSIYSFVQDLSSLSPDFNFKKTHSKALWGFIIKFDPGKPIYSTWLYILMAYLSFFIFGLGKDALHMYSTFLRRIGLGSVVNMLKGMTTRKNTDAQVAQMMGKLVENEDCLNYSELEDLRPQGITPCSATHPTNEANIFIDYRLPYEIHANIGLGHTAHGNLQSELEIDRDIENLERHYTIQVTKRYSPYESNSMDTLGNMSPGKKGEENNEDLVHAYPIRQYNDTGIGDSDGVSPTTLAYVDQSAIMAKSKPNSSQEKRNSISHSTEVIDDEKEKN